MRISIGFVLAVAALVSFAASAALAGPILIVDQQNLASTSTVGNGGLGQSFTPTLLGLDAVELTTGGPKNLVNETIDIRLGDGFGGAIIATSSPLSGLFAAGSILHFDFAATVALTPGNQYTIATGLSSLLHSNPGGGDTYFGGRMWVNGVGGFSPGNTDLVFREGLHVPEPSTLALLGLGVLALVRKRRKETAA